MGDVHVITTADALHGSHAFQHNFQLFVAPRCALCRNFLVSFESPGRHSLLVAVIPVKALTGVEYTKVFRCPHSQKSRRLRSGDCAGQSAWPQHSVDWFIESLVQVLSDNEVMPHHEWTTCVDVEEAHVPRVLVNHSPKNNGTLHLLVC
jgi:hypothetical protein